MDRLQVNATLLLVWGQAHPVLKDATLDLDAPVLLLVQVTVLLASLLLLAHLHSHTAA